MTNRKRFLIIGLDGFTWKLATPFIKDGTMPFLGELVKKGCHGNLHSAMPYETAPSWASFQTGCEPGKTGIFSFHTYNRAKNQIHLNSYFDIKPPTIWEIADKAGKKVVSINMPVTSPPPKLENGIIIPGLLCPGLSPETTHPSETYRKYIESVENYTVVHKDPEDTDEEFIANSIKTVKSRRQVALEIMRDVDWDIFSVQMQSTDAFQHRFWCLLDPDKVPEDSTLKKQALEFYRQCDEVIKKLVEAAGENTTTTIVSDHGFCSGKTTVGLNVWLRQNGYLKLLTPNLTTWDKIKRSCPPLKTLANIIGPILKRRPVRDGDELYCKTIVSHLRKIVDFDSTSALCLSGISGILYVKAQGDDKRKIVEEITAGLIEQFGPDSNSPVIEKILPAGDVYSKGDNPDIMPDAVVYFVEGVEHRINPMGDEVVFDKPLDGTHAKEGVFVASGNEIKHMQMDCDIIDIVPTILAWIGVAVPSHIDGKVLKDIFTVEVDDLREDMASDSKGKAKYSDAEQSAVEKQLKDLGYL